MKLVKGSKLTVAQRADVLNAFGGRWTVENVNRARAWHGIGAPTTELTTDAQWLADHAFYITSAGHLAENRHHAEPHYLAD